MRLDELNWRTRFALGAALSPVVLGLQLYSLRRVSLDFPTAVIVIVFLNLPSLFLILRSLPEVNLRRLFSLTTCVALIICSSLVGLMVTLWLAIPNFRTVSWHALLHTDIVYLVTRTPFLVEEPDLANIALAAPWMDHVYWSITGWLTDFPPTVLYPISNVIWLVVAFLLGYELAVQGLGLQSATALWSAGLTFVGTNVIGALGFFFTGKWEVLGDIRYTPVLGKYFNFDVMPFAFALIIGLSLLCVVIVEKDARRVWSIVPMVLIAIGLVYPIVFPVGCLLVSFTLILLYARTLGNFRKSARIWLPLCVGFVFSVIAFLAYLQVIISERSVSTYQLHTFDVMKTRLRYSVVALLPLLIVGAPFIFKGIRVWRGSIILLAGTALICIALYITVALSNLEYKFILAATLILMPLAAGGLEILLLRWRRLRWLLSAVTAPGLVLFFALLILKTGVQIPDNLANTPAVIEDSFLLRLDKKESDSGWTGAVRQETPEDTIVVLNSSRIHIASFANRALFFPGLGDGDAMAGYSVPKEYYLLGQRGYPKAKFDSRSSIVRTIYTESNLDKVADALRTLLELQRPIAVHFANPYTPSLLWLKKSNIGAELYSDSTNVVWFINRELALSNRDGSATDATDVGSAISSAGNGHLRRHESR